MERRVRGTISMAAIGAVVLAVGACKGDRGPAGPPGPAGGTTSGTTPGGAAQAPARLYAKITAASIPNGGGQGGAPTVTYRLYRDAAFTQDAGTCTGGGASGFDAFVPNFTASKLIDDPTTPGTKAWQSYINRLIGSFKVATTEGGRGTVAGTVKDNGDGSCTYTFKSDLSQKAPGPSTTAAVTEAYDPAAVTRIGMQNNPNSLSPTSPAFDGWADVAPGGGQIQTGNAREIVATQACNQCHRDLAHHGAKRLSTEYCVTCHNPGTPDPDPTSVNSTSLNFAVLIHKIHQGGDLPSVTGKNVNGTAIPGASPGKIVINGTDFTFVGFPQDTGNCTVCHAVTSGTGNDYWKNQPSIEACGACHDRVDFTASAPNTTGGTPPKAGYIAHPAGAVQDGQCAACHAEGKQVPVTSFHHIGIPTPAQQKANYKIVSITNSTPGNKPTVTISVTNPASAGAAFDLATDPLWNAGGNSRLFLDLGWTVKPGEDWTNTGSGATTGFGSAVANGSPAPGQPVQIDLLAGAKASPPTVIKNGDGTYSVTSPTAIPSDAVGSGVAVLEGHPGTTTTTYPVTTATSFFPITDAQAQSRRQVVDIQKCDKCHGMLNLHGNNRNDNINACVTCHNSEATDVTQRSGTGIDGKTEQSIDFAILVHGIHAGAQDPATTGIVVYPFTGKAGGGGPGTPVDFRDVQFPEGNSVGRCDNCHADSNPYPSADIGIVNGITITTSDSADPATYLRTTRIAAVCSSCHQTADAVAHIAANGGAGVTPVGTTTIDGSGLTQAQIDQATKSPGVGTETCAICHGQGQAFDPIKFHGR